MNTVVRSVVAAALVVTALVAHAAGGLVAIAHRFGMDGVFSNYADLAAAARDRMRH